MYKLIAVQDDIIPHVMVFMYENTMAFSYNNDIMRVNPNYIEALNAEFGETIKLKKVKLKKLK